MRKIKDNGRTLELKRSRTFLNCDSCCLDSINYDGDGLPICPTNGDSVLVCTTKYNWRETLPSKLSRLIKRMVRK